MNSTRKAIIYFALASLALLYGDPCGHLRAGRPTIDAITLAWKQKEQRTAHAVFEWNDTITTPKNEFSVLQAKLAGRKPPSGSVTYDESSVLKFAGDKWRLDNDGRVFNSQGELVSQLETLVYKDGELRAHMPAGVFGYPIGNIDDASFSTIPHAANLRPLFFVYRPISAGLINLADFRISTTTGWIGKVECLILKPRQDGSDTSTIWVAPEMDFAIMRYTKSKRGATSLTLDFEYVVDSSRRWTPKHWFTRTVDRKGRLIHTIKGQMARSDIAIREDSADFDVEFPPGTWVRDFTRPSDLGNNTQYIVREGGAKRIVTAADQGATYDQLVKSEPGQALVAQHRGIPRLWITMITVTLLALGVLCVVYYRKLRARQVR